MDSKNSKDVTIFALNEIDRAVLMEDVRFWMKFFLS